MCAKHYENPTMLSRVTAKNVGDVFFGTHCILHNLTSSVINVYDVHNTGPKFTVYTKSAKVLERMLAEKMPQGCQFRSRHSKFRARIGYTDRLFCCVTSTLTQ